MDLDWWAGIGGDGSDDTALLSYGDPESARFILGSKVEPRGMEGKGQVLTSSDFNSLVIDSLCD